MRRAGVRTGIGRIAGVVLAVLVSPIPSDAAAQAREPAAAPGRGDDLGEHGTRVPVLSDLELLGHAAVHTIAAPLRWDGRTWLTLPVAAGGLALITLVDDEVRDAMRRNRGGLDDVVAGVERFGTVENFWVLGGFFVAGVAIGDERARSVAAEGLASSLIAAGLITPALQRITGRSRPRSASDVYAWDPFSGNISFPSGHTTQAFAVASVIAAEYDAWWVDAASYGLAAAVAACRIYEDAHHLSDVTAAALIGTAVGRAVVDFGRAHRGSIGVRPLLRDGAPGLAVHVRF